MYFLRRHKRVVGLQLLHKAVNVDSALANQRITQPLNKTITQTDRSQHDSTAGTQSRKLKSSNTIRARVETSE